MWTIIWILSLMSNTSKRKQKFVLKLYHYCDQGLVKGAILCFRNLYFYFWHGENTSTASQLSKEINKVPHLLQNLDYFNYFRTFGVDAKFLYNVTLSDFVALSELVKFRLKLEHFFLEITVNFLKMWIAIYSVLKKEGIKHGGII